MRIYNTFLVSGTPLRVFHSLLHDSEQGNQCVPKCINVYMSILYL